jgi:hypothetical protein
LVCRRVWVSDGGEIPVYEIDPVDEPNEASDAPQSKD